MARQPVIVIGALVLFAVGTRLALDQTLRGGARRPELPQPIETLLGQTQ